MANCNGVTETHNGFHHGNDDNSSETMNIDNTGRCKECGCPGHDKILGDITKSLTSIELNLNVF